jgi:ATP-dependent DNA ligase
VRKLDLSPSIYFGATAKICIYSPLTERKHKLRSILLTEGDHIMYCDHVDRDGESLFRLACENDLECIVAKRKLDP